MTPLEELRAAAEHFCFADRMVFEDPDNQNMWSLRAVAYEMWLAAVRRFRKEGRG